MWVGKFAWHNLNANRDRIYGKFSQITSWAFDLRLEEASVPMFSLNESHLDYTSVRIDRFMSFMFGFIFVEHTYVYVDVVYTFNFFI